MGKATMLMLSLMVFGMLSVVANSARSLISPNEITCEEAVELLMPCQEYLKGTGAPTPPPTCCASANEVFQKADTTPCRRNICECFKKAAVQLGVEVDRARKLPELCHIPLSIPIDPKTDCNTIS